MSKFLILDFDIDLTFDIRILDLFLALFLLRLQLNDLPSLVAAASRADAVRHRRFGAFRAFDQIGFG